MRAVRGRVRLWEPAGSGDPLTSALRSGEGNRTQLPDVENLADVVQGTATMLTLNNGRKNAHAATDSQFAVARRDLRLTTAGLRHLARPGTVR